MKAKRAELVNISSEALSNNEFYIHGHSLSNDEIFEAIWDSDYGSDQEINGLTKEKYKENYEIEHKIEKWGRWGFCEEMERDEYPYCLHTGKANQRGAFAYTIVKLKEKTPTSP